MQKTTTFLLFAGKQAGKAEEAIKFYTTLLKNSKINSIKYFKNNKDKEQQNQVKHAEFTIAGQEYMAADGGLKHNFNFTPSISIYINCDSEEEIDELYKKLSVGGEVMMPLDNYPFSQKFGWTSDRYGISWQLNLKFDCLKKDNQQKQ